MISEHFKGEGWKLESWCEHMKPGRSRILVLACKDSCNNAYRMICTISISCLQLGSYYDLVSFIKKKKILQMFSAPAMPSHLVRYFATGPSEWHTSDGAGRSVISFRASVVD